MKYLLLIILSVTSNASIINTVDKKVDVQKKSTKKRNSIEMNALKKLSEQNVALLKLLQIKANEEKPFIWDGTKKIESTKVIRGLLLNSVVSTNLESPLLVESLDSSILPSGTRFRCTGVTKNKRVLTVCDRMITPSKEVEVKVQVLNIDGTAGLRGEYNDGKDSYIAGAIVSEFAKGVISASKDKVVLPLGSIDSDSEKNKLLEGLASSMSTTTDLITDSMKSQEPKVFIEAGKPVLIFFMEGLNGY
jgi:hypothetical protein